MGRLFFNFAGVWLPAMFPESHLEVLSAWGLLCEWVTECVYNKSWGQLIKIGLFCDIMKIFCFPFTFLLGSLISRLHVRVMWMKRGRQGAGAECQGISLPLATVNERCPSPHGFIPQKPSTWNSFFPFPFKKQLALYVGLLVDMNYLANWGLKLNYKLRTV